MKLINAFIDLNFVPLLELGHFTKKALAPFIFLCLPPKIPYYFPVGPSPRGISVTGDFATCEWLGGGLSPPASGSHFLVIHNRDLACDIFAQVCQVLQRIGGISGLSEYSQILIFALRILQ